MISKCQATEGEEQHNCMSDAENKRTKVYNQSLLLSCLLPIQPQYCFKVLGYSMSSQDGTWRFRHRSLTAQFINHLSKHFDLLTLIIGHLNKRTSGWAKGCFSFEEKLFPLHHFEVLFELWWVWRQKSWRNCKSKPKPAAWMQFFLVILIGLTHWVGEYCWPAGQCLHSSYEIAVLGIVIYRAECY